MGDDDRDAQLEELMEQCEAQLEQLAEKNDELQELRDRNAQLEEEIQGSGKGGNLELADENRELRSRLELTEEELEKAMDRAREQESKARDADLQIKALQMEKLKLESEVQSEQERADQAAEELAMIRQRSEQIAENEGRRGATEKTQKRTLMKTLIELEEAQKEVSDLKSVVDSLCEELNKKESLVEEAQKSVQDAEQEKLDLEEEVEELKRHLREKEQEILAAQEELGAVGEIEQEIKDTVSAKIEKWKAKVRQAQSELEEEKQKQAALQKKCDSLLMESGLREIEQQLVRSQEASKTMSRELEAKREEVLVLARENSELKSDQGKFINLALEKEKQELERLRRVISTKDAQIEEERARYKELYEEKGDLEEELQDREFTLAEYERGHGLTEAVLKQKKLKGDIKRRDKEIRRLNQGLSERISAYERLFETCRRLKKKAGLPDTFEFDDLELEEGMKGQSERLQGLIRELEAQNEALENDRLRLLESLRKNALNIGEKGMKFYGLSAEQVVLVNEFAENLRDGRTDLPLNDKSLELQRQVQELKRQVRDLERDVAAAELANDGGPGGGGLSPSGMLMRQQQQSSGALTEASTEQLDKNFQMLAKRQMAAVEEIKNELRNLVTNQQQRAQPGSATDGVRLGSGAESYDKLVSMLESKLDVGGGRADTARDDASSSALRDELERQRSLNEELSRRLSDMQTRLSEQQHVGGGGQALVLSASSPRQPMSSNGLGPLGQAFYHTHTESLRLPPEEWADQYLLLQKQLAFCMEQVRLKEKEVARSERSLRSFEEKAEVMATQMGALYREYAQAKADWERRSNSLKKEADEARNERDALRAKARRLDTLCAVLESEDEAVPRDHVKELTRKIAVLEVNEVVLARKYNLIAHEERILRNDSELLQQQMVQSEASLRERVLFLEEWKAGAQAQLTSMATKLEKSVPRDAHEEGLRKLAQVRQKYRDLLQREASLRNRTSGSHALRRRVHGLEVELDTAQATVSKLLQEAAARDPARGGPHDDHEPQSSGSIDELARLRGEAVEKEVLLQSTLKRADIFENRSKELMEQLTIETKRADEADATTENARQVIAQLEQEIVELRDTYQGGANRAERRVLEERIEELEGMFGALKREASRYRELADIASAQVQTIDASNQAREKEITDLRAQLRELNARSDDDAIIGKIQHELTRTKVSYHMFARKFELAKASIRRGELERAQLEAQANLKDQMIFSTREEARARILALQSALEELGALAPLGKGSTTAGNGPEKTVLQEQVQLSGMERLSETIARLGDSAERSEEALRRSEAARRALEGQLEKQQIELDAARSAMADLRRRVLASSAGESDVTEHQGLAKRLLDLNEELKDARVECMRQKRELLIVREEKAYLEKLREKDEEHMSRLEEAIANTENALRRQQDDRTLHRASDPAATDGLGLPLLAVSKSKRGQSLLGGDQENRPQNSNVDPLEEEERMEAQRAMVTELSEVRSNLRQAEMREDQLERKLAEAKMSISFLKRRLGAEGLDDSMEDGATPPVAPRGGGGQVNRYYEADARKLQAAAQQTIASLKDSVARKNATIESMREKMEAMRSTALAERQRDQAEIQRLTEKLYEDNKMEIGNLRTAYENVYTAPDGSRRAAGGDLVAEADGSLHRDMMDRLEEADVMLERKDRRILELERIAEEMQILRQKAEDKAAQNAEIAQRLGQKMRLLSQRGSGPEQLVKQLRGELLAKDKKLHGLRTAVIALKNEFVKSEEEHEEELVRKDREIATVKSGEPGAPKQSVDVSGASKRQLQALKERVERLREDLEDQRHREETLQKENDRLSRQLEEQLQSETRQEELSSTARKSVRAMERQVDDLKRENRRLQEMLANTNPQLAASAGEDDLLEEQKQQDRGRRSAANASDRQVIADLERKLKVAQAQNAAFRSASRSAPTSQTLSSATGKWQADKKLERQLGTLSKKMEEAKREREAEHARAEQAKSLVERLSRENKQLKGRIAKLTSPQAIAARSSSAAAASSSSSSFHDRAQHTELLRETQVEQRAEINRLTREVRATRERSVELEEEADMLRQRLRQQSRQKDSLERAEDDFAVQDELRTQLALSRKECRALESELLERDNKILELRFALEQASSDAQSVSDGQLFQGSPVAGGAPRKPGERFKRERDLENVIDSMKKVVTKLQSENTKLRRTAGSSAKASQLSKQLSAIRAEKEELERTNGALSRRIQERGDTMADKIRLQDALRGCKRQLKSAKDEIAENESRVKILEDQLEQAQISRENARFSQEENVANMRSRLAEQQELIAQLRRSGGASARSSRGGGLEPRERAELERLREENQRLMNELNAFDIDFFEEIEDLKYKYMKAKEELKAYRERG